MNFNTYSFKDLLSDIVDNRGKTCPVEDSGMPLIATNCIKENTLYPVFEKVRYVSDDTYKTWFRGHPKSGDMIFVCKGSPGRVNWVPDPVSFCIAQDMVSIRADETKVYPKYLFALLRSKVTQQKILNMHVGTLIPHFKKGDFGNLYFDIPEDMDYQKKVGDAYFDFCLKIEANAQLNRTLEEMAQTIFKSWFVDFDPVKAKMNGEQPEGMDAATASLFPEKLVESELGLIPEGWEVGTLDSHTSMIIDHRGKTPKKLGSDWVEEGYPAISAKNIKSKKIVRPDTIRFIDEATYKKWMKEPLIKRDIIMTSEAPMGELYFFDGSEDFCLSQRLYGLRAKSDVCSPEFLFNWLQTTKAKVDMEGRASGTTALGIKQAELRKVKILTPPLELLEKYSAIASNLVDMAAKNNAQNTVLEDLRDTLLPKLLSGEVEL